MTNCLHIFSNTDHPFLHLVPFRLTAIPFFSGPHHHRLTAIGVGDQLLAPPPDLYAYKDYVNGKKLNKINLSYKLVINFYTTLYNHNVTCKHIQY